MLVQQLRKKNEEQLKNYFFNKDVIFMIVHPLYFNYHKIVEAGTPVLHKPYTSAYEKIKEIAPKIKAAGVRFVYIFTEDLLWCIMDEKIPAVSRMQPIPVKIFLSDLEKHEIKPKEKDLLLVGGKSSLKIVYEQVKQNLEQEKISDLFKKGRVKKIVLVGEAGGEGVRSVAEYFNDHKFKCYRIDECIFWESSLAYSQERAQALAAGAEKIAKEIGGYEDIKEDIEKAKSEAKEEESLREKSVADEAELKKITTKLTPGKLKKLLEP